jgi:hypothetical protein
MVEIADIKDRGSLEEWLNTFSDDEEVRRDAAVAIAVRAALRVLPIAWLWLSTNGSSNSALPNLRASLLSHVGASLPTENLKRLILSVQSEQSFRKLVPSQSTIAANITAETAAESIVGDVKNVVELSVVATQSAFVTVQTLGHDVWSEITADCTMILENKQIWSAPLWTGENPVEEMWENVRLSHTPRAFGTRKFGETTFGTVTGGPWEFWIGWYEKILAGAPQDWDLLQAIVDQVDWDGAPEEVNRQIQQIERDHLRDTVRRLKEETSNVLAIEDELPSRGHNNPPEMIKDDADAMAAITFIWADLDDAEKELEKDEPDPSALKRLGDALKTGSWKVLKYLGQKADLAVDGVVKEGAKSSTTWLIRALGVGYFSQLEAIQSAGRALLEFAQRLFQAGGMM